MKTKISAITITWKPGHIDVLAASLKGQTFTDFEFILVDDLCSLRRDAVRQYVGDSFRLKHMPPSEILPHTAPSVAWNTGLSWAEGELVYFMIDHIYLHPRVLERHWEIYQKYGSGVLISGPCIDAINITGKSVFEVGPQVRQVIEGGKPLVYPEHIPPISWELKDDFQEVKPENYITIYKAPYIPQWPRGRARADWRTAQIANISLEKDLYENVSGPKWWWAGLNDSAPLEALLAVNGFDESQTGLHDNVDAELSQRLAAWGCRHLVDTAFPVINLPNPVRKAIVHDVPRRVWPSLKEIRSRQLT